MNSQTLRIVPLGGLGRVGGNMMVYETDDALLVVDCGINFAPEHAGVDFTIPDLSYVERRSEKLVGYAITHGHEDHLGALPYALAHLPAPVWAGRFCRAQLEMKLYEHPHLDVEIHTLEDFEQYSLGPFRLTPIPVTHSIPGASSFAIETPVGRIVHTGDFRIDPSPPDNRGFATDTFRELGDQGVEILLSDSTNAERPGRTWSEREVAECLDRIVGEASGRVLVTTFASNVQRIQSVINASANAGRTVLPVGRSIAQTVQMSLERGFLKAPRGIIADASHFADLTREQTTVLASGSQGEERGAFARIGAGTHGTIALDPGDTVILSCRKIPGNERQIGAAINSYYRLGTTVIDDRDERVHTSGHAFRDEQREMLDLCRPRFFVPVHGEYRHLVHHARLAEAAGVAPEHIFVTEDGHPLEVTRTGGKLSMRRAAPVEFGDCYLSRNQSIEVDPIVLRDRSILAESGIVFAAVLLDDDDRRIGIPEIATRGLFFVDERPDLLEDARDALIRAVDAPKRSPRLGDDEGWSELIRQGLKKHFRRAMSARPLIVAVVLRVP